MLRIFRALKRTLSWPSKMLGGYGLGEILLSDKELGRCRRGNTFAFCSVIPFYHDCRVWSVDFFPKFTTRHFSSLTKNSFIFHGSGRNDPRSSTARPRLERDLWSEIPRLHLAVMMRWLLRGGGDEGGDGRGRTRTERRMMALLHR